MQYKKAGMLLPVFILAVLLFSGCATLTEGQSAVGSPGQFQQQIKERDTKISSLQEIIDDQQKQLRQLSDELNECNSAGKPSPAKTASTKN
jgi:TolA-binding protein